jgi:hypothetical protein
VLPARGFRRLSGELMLEVVLPDGSAGMVPAAATDVLGEQPPVEPAPGTVLSVDGARRLRALLVAKSRGSSEPRDPPPRGIGSPPHSRQRDVEVSQVAKAQDSRSRSGAADDEPAGGRRRAGG